MAEDKNRRKEEKADEPTKLIPSPSLDERNIWGRMERKERKKKKIRIGDDLILSDRLCSYRLQSRQMISGEERERKEKKKTIIRREVKVKQFW